MTVRRLSRLTRPFSAAQRVAPRASRRTSPRRPGACLISCVTTESLGSTAQRESPALTDETENSTKAVATSSDFMVPGYLGRWTTEPGDEAGTPPEDCTK